MHATQRQRTRDLLQEVGLERALFAHLDSVKWLTGYAPQVQLGGNHFAGGPALIWFEDGHFTLVVLDMDAEQSGSFDDEPDGTLLTYAGYAMDEPITSPANLAAALGRLMARASGPIGLEKEALPAHLYEKVRQVGEPVAIDGELVPLRMIKTPEEIELLRRNFELTDLGHRVAAAAVRPGQREIDVWTDIHGAINRQAGSRVPLGNDCVVGYREPNNVGGWPRDFELKDDTALIVDLSTVYGGYWSDSCNTYYATEPDKKQFEIHKVIEDTLAYAISLVRPGVPCREIDRKVKAFIEQAGFEPYPHHTGHGVGVSVHEAPRITPYNDTLLAKDMVIMLEPGIYFPGETGCRLEHGLLVTDDGAEVLTGHIEKL